MGLGAGGRVVHRQHPGANAATEAEDRTRIVRIDRRGEAIAVAVGEGERLVEVAERRYSDNRAEGLRAVDLIIGGDAVDDRGMAVEPGVGVADEAGARVIRSDPSGRARAGHRVVVADELEPAEE